MDKELTILINMILKKTMVTMRELELETYATRRQVTYRIDKINSFLRDNGFPLLLIGKQRDILIAPETRKFLVDFIRSNHLDSQYYLNKKERMDYIYMLLFVNQRYSSLQHLVSALQVSRSSVINDIKELNNELLEHQIQISNTRDLGYYLSGAELDVRSYMMKLIILSLSEERNTVILDLLIEDMYLDTFDYSKLIISELSIKHGIVFVGDRLDEFIYIFVFLKARINNSTEFDFDGQYLPYFEMVKLMKEFAFTTELLLYYKNTSGMNEKEQNYISIWILAVSIGNINDNTQDSSIIGDIARRIMNRFEFISGNHYYDSTEIFQQLYSHFRPAYYRLLFKLPIFNPLCQRIQIQYKDFYNLVEETMKPFQVLFGKEIPEDELAYLTVHFASIFSNQRESDEITKKRALVVCSNGIGSSAILYNQLKEMFPELHFYYPIEATKLNDFEDVVDIIFTTLPHSSIMGVECPFIRVNPIMDLREKYEVMSEVYSKLGNPMFKQPSIDTIMTMIKKHGQIHDEAALYNEFLLYFSSNKSIAKKENEGYFLSDILTKELILLNIDVENWEQAIRVSGEKLVENHHVTQEYIDKILELNQDKPHYMVIAPQVALPHTRPEYGVNSCAMGLATLKNPIMFGESENNPVKYIFFLSALDNHQHLPAMSELLELLNDEIFYQVLTKAHNEDEIIEYIRSKEQVIL